jgi:polyisoprenoid-binding protein YceI
VADLRAEGGAGPVRWTAPTGQSRIGFLLHTFWHDVEGTTTSLEAVVDSAGGDPLVDGRIRVSVEAAALDTGINRRDRKMREEHLEVADHPLIQFQSTEAPRPMTSKSRSGGGAPFVEMIGDLTIHGVTHRITVPVEAEMVPDGWIMKARLLVKMSDYQISDPSIFLNKVQDEVGVYFEIRLTRDAGWPANPSRSE